MPKEDRFEGIRELIRKGKYDQARVLLQMMPDDPRAQEWLARLNRVSPAKEDKVVRAALAEIDQTKPERSTQPKPRRRRWGRVWLALRVFFIMVLLCQCVWVIPLLNTLGVMPEAIAEFEMPLPPVVEESLDAVADSPVGKTVTDFTDRTINQPIERANENIQEEVMARGFQQAAPMLDRMCEERTSNYQEERLCKDLMRDMRLCVAQGGTLDSCLDEVMTDVCRTYFRNDPYAYNTCMQEMYEIKSQLP